LTCAVFVSRVDEIGPHWLWEPTRAGAVFIWRYGYVN